MEKVKLWVVLPWPMLAEEKQNHEGEEKAIFFAGMYAVSVWQGRGARTVVESFSGKNRGISDIGGEEACNNCRIALSAPLPKRRLYTHFIEKLLKHPKINQNFKFG